MPEAVQGTVKARVQMAFDEIQEVANRHIEDFFTSIGGVLESTKVSDDDFVAAIEALVYFSGRDLGTFADSALMTTDRLRLWMTGKNLPAEDQRPAVLKLCSHNRPTMVDVKAFIAFVCGDRTIAQYGLDTLVAELDLSVRTTSCLRNDNIATLGELLAKSEAELLRTPNFGRKSLEELKEILEPMGYWFKGSKGRGMHPEVQKYLEAKGD